MDKAKEYLAQKRCTEEKTMNQVLVDGLVALCKGVGPEVCEFLKWFLHMLVETIQLDAASSLTFAGVGAETAAPPIEPSLRPSHGKLPAGKTGEGRTVGKAERAGKTGRAGKCGKGGKVMEGHKFKVGMSNRIIGIIVGL